MYLVHAGRINLLKLLPSAQRVAEVGVFRGEFSKLLMEILQAAELVLVDKWEANKAALLREHYAVAYEGRLRRL